MHEKVELSKLSDAERKLYLMIARAYIMQFSPSHIYFATKISVECKRETFTATGKMIRELGWHALYAPDANEKDDARGSLLEMREREVVNYERGKILSARRRLPLHSLRLRTSKP